MKLKELDERHRDELAEFRSGKDREKTALEASFGAQLGTLRACYAETLDMAGDLKAALQASSDDERVVQDIHGNPLPESAT